LIGSKPPVALDGRDTLKTAQKNNRVLNLLTPNGYEDEPRVTASHTKQKKEENAKILVDRFRRVW